MSRILSQDASRNSGRNPRPPKLASRSRNRLVRRCAATTCRRPRSTRARTVVRSRAAILVALFSSGSEMSSVVFMGNTCCTANMGSNIIAPALRNGNKPSCLRPLHHRRHRRQDRVDIAAGLEAESGAAVVEQVELDIAAAAHQLLLALGFAPGLGEIAPHQPGIDLQKGAADLLGEGEGRLPVGLEIIVEDAADAAHLVAVLEEEVA